MGMFDYVVCHHPLPGTPPAFVRPGHRFQTKDLECELRTYEIAADGAFSDPGYTGDVEFYGSNIRASGPGVYTAAGEDAESVTYVATIHAGKLVGIVETEREVEAALPVAAVTPVVPMPTREAEVVAEGKTHWCARTADGELELLYRADRDRIVWDTEAEARAERGSETAAWEVKAKAYAARVAERAAETK